MSKVRRKDMAVMFEAAETGRARKRERGLSEKRKDQDL